MNDICDDAVVRFNSGFNCSQAVFAALAETVGVSEDEALKIAAPFGGGIVGSQERQCGVVSGALMAFGARYFSVDNRADSKALVYSLSRRFMEEFVKLHGHTGCLELIGKVAFGTEEGNRMMSEGGIKKEKCELYVRDACRIVIDLLNEKDQEL